MDVATEFKFVTDKLDRLEILVTSADWNSQEEYDEAQETFDLFNDEEHYNRLTQPQKVKLDELRSIF